MLNLPKLTAALVVLFAVLQDFTCAAPSLSNLPTKDGTYTDSIAKMNAAITCPNGLTGASE